MKTKLILAAALLSTATVFAEPAGVVVPAPAPDPAVAEDHLDSLVVLRSLKTESFVAPSMSHSMEFSIVTRARVRVAVKADRKGNVADWQILAYSHKDLADSTERVVRMWRFTPSAVDGVPVSAQTEFDIEYRGPDVVTISPVMDQMEFIYRNMGAERLEYRPCTLSELDRIPLLLNVITPRYSIEARELGVRGVVEVKFYIDERGNVRMPAVVNADRIDLAEAAIEAVEQWKFEPPTRNGRPVLIAAIQQFNFGLGVPPAGPAGPAE